MGLPLPDFIANAPKLEIGLQFFLQAFFDLDTERSHSMGVTMIPWSSIKDYAVTYELNDEDTEDLIYLIRQMDLEHTKRLSRKNGSKPS
jgi:hypothetical protein